MVETASTPPDARQQRTRAVLLDALLLLLETRPFDRISIREIAGAAGIGYATFFRHYTSKDALLEDLAAGEIAALLAQAMPAFFGHEVRQSCVSMFAYVDERRALWSALLTGGAAASLKAEFTAQARALAEGGDEMESWLPGDLSVVYAVGATVEIIAWWLRQGPEFGVDRIAEILDGLVVTPVLSKA